MDASRVQDDDRGEIGAPRFSRRAGEDPEQAALAAEEHGRFFQVAVSGSDAGRAGVAAVPCSSAAGAILEQPTLDGLDHGVGDLGVLRPT